MREERVINSIYSTPKELKKKYDELKKNNK